MKLQTRMVLALIAGSFLGLISRLPLLLRFNLLLILLEPVGTAFIRLITMVVVPLVVASLFLGIASVGDIRRLGRIGGRTLAWFAASTFMAALVGTMAALGSRVGTGVSDATRA